MMKLTNKEVIDLIKASALNNADIFFTFERMPDRAEIEKYSAEFSGKTLVLTPGKPFNKTGERVIYADIKAAMDESFNDLLCAQSISEILLPFYECADISEYGYKASYANIAEIRASAKRDFHITGFSPNVTKNEKLFSLFGSKRFIQAGNEGDTVFSGIKSASDKSKYHCVAAECEKSPFKKTVVLFSTRRQAEEFSLFLYKRRTPFAMIHGGVDGTKRRAALKSFITGDVNILLATKFIIASYALISADKLIYCGLPYSASHARRCKSLSKSNEIDFIFSDDDITLTQKLIASFAKELQIDYPDYIESRNKMFSEFLSLLQY